MNPIALRIAAMLTAAAVGWTVNGWRKDAQISSIKAERAQDKADQAQAALNDLAAAARSVRAAADGYTADSASLSAKLESLRKDFKNAKPLPIGCRPDDFRVRHLGAAVDAVNQAAAGQ